jgi:hypothetical protein
VGQAHAELAYGSWFRRQRRAADSGGVLGPALAAFDRIGASVRVGVGCAEMTATRAGQPSSGIRCIPCAQV